MMSLLSVPIVFKEVYTTNVRSLHVNPNWTISQFIETITSELSNAFELDPSIIEIVEAGQYDDGVPPEYAPALVVSEDNSRLKDKWGIKMAVAFYVRRKGSVPANLNIPVVDECPICYERVSLHSRYECTHRVCNPCHRRCLASNYTICPLCRA